LVDQTDVGQDQSIVCDRLPVALAAGSAKLLTKCDIRHTDVAGNKIKSKV